MSPEQSYQWAVFLYEGYQSCWNAFWSTKKVLEPRLSARISSWSIQFVLELHLSGCNVAWSTKIVQFQETNFSESRITLAELEVSFAVSSKA